MKVVSNQRRMKAPGLVRFAASASGRWLIADNDMNAVYIARADWPEFRPLAQALFLKLDQQRVRIPGLLGFAEQYASRCYMGSALDLPDGGALFECKFGVKEVEDAGISFDKPDRKGRVCAWGMFVARTDAEGVVIWARRYQIHKGNAMIVAGGDPSQARLIATGGECWVLNVADGEVVSKSHVPMGESGEKVYATASGCSCVGYTGHPSTVARFGRDPSAVPVQSKPPYNIGADEWRCANCTPDAQPNAIWWAMILLGQILYNFVGPKMSGRAKHPVDKLPSGGSADAEIRQPIALFQIPGSKSVGAAFKDDGFVYAQVLDKVSTRVKIGPGAWPAAVRKGDLASVFYRNGDYVYEAVIGY